MLSIRKLSYAATLFSVFAIFSCGEKSTDKDVVQPLKNLDDQEILLEETKKVLGDSIDFAKKGEFVKDSLNEVAAAMEISERDIWGIKFFLLNISGNELNKTFETNVLDGSLKGSRLEKINIEGYDYDLLYYNSLDYFLGSGGGEIFSYIIDFNEQKTFYAHLVTDKKRGILLHLSENITSPSIKDFFLKNFKKDYPSLTLVTNDIDLSF